MLHWHILCVHQHWLARTFANTSEEDEQIVGSQCRTGFTCHTCFKRGPLITVVILLTHTPRGRKTYGLLKFMGYEGWPRVTFGFPKKLWVILMGVYWLRDVWVKRVTSLTTVGLVHKCSSLFLCLLVDQAPTRSTNKTNQIWKVIQKLYSSQYQHSTNGSDT